MKKLIALMLLFSAGSAYAVPVEWTLKDMYLENRFFLGLDGGVQITGSFVFDADAPLDICPPYAYVCATSTAYSDFQLQFDFVGEDIIELFGESVTLTPQNAFVDYVDNYGETVITDERSLVVVCNYINACDPPPFDVPPWDPEWASPGLYEFGIGFDEALTNAGGEVLAGAHFSFYQSVLGNYWDFANITGGSVVANVVPIPAAVYLFGAA